MNNFSRTPEHLSASFVSFIASIASHHAGGFAQSMMAQARRQTCRSGVTAHCSAAHRPGSTSRAQTSPSPPARSLLLVPLPLDDLRHRKAKTSAFGRVAAEAQAKASAFGRAAAEAQAQAASLSLSPHLYLAQAQRRLPDRGGADRAASRPRSGRSRRRLQTHRLSSALMVRITSDCINGPDHLRSRRRLQERRWRQRRVGAPCGQHRLSSALMALTTADYGPVECPQH